MGGSNRPRSDPAAPDASAVPIQPSRKAAAAAPRLDSDMEMGSLPTDDAGPDGDIMHLARIGDVAAMEKVFESGNYDATFNDDEGITALHWAAINNQYSMCKFLIEHGAEINKKGGESVATPLQWAAQRSHYYTVNLLLQHGADPLLSDAQGYNTLHISTFNGNLLLIILLLHQGIPVDVADSFGHTPLMWAAYKGFPHCVDVFLRWGASVQAADEQGFTALHWALVKGNPGCIVKLIEYGADRFAKTDTGKTPALTAAELNTQPAWHRALRECGYDEDARPSVPPWPGASYFLQDKRTFVSRFLFFWPFVLTWAVLFELSRSPLFLGLPLALVVIYVIHWCAKQVLEYAPPDMRHFHKTPWMAGIFAGSLFLVGLDWLFVILPVTWSESRLGSGAGKNDRVQGDGRRHVILNSLFALLYALTTFFYAASMRYDPGYVPKLKGIAEQRAVIDELIKEWKYDESSFCVLCMIRMPLRSKHCRRCQRCVAKHDHHCPWVYNCVGINNHRHFFLYLICLTVGILAYDWLLYYYYGTISPHASDSCRVLSANLCKLVNSDAYSLILAVWVSLQLVWVTMLLLTQLFQVSRGMTTYENMTGIRTGSSTTTVLTSTGAPLDPSLVSADGSDGRSGGTGVGVKEGLVKQWSRLLGVDAFIETLTGRGAATSKSRRRKRNPYNRGCVSNCRDFWCDPAPVFGTRESGSGLLGGDKVNYAELYESPMLMMRLGGRRGRGGYEALGTDEESL